MSSKLARIKSLAFTIERYIPLETVLEEIISAEQMESLSALYPEHTYHYAVTIDGDEEIDAEPFGNDLLDLLMLTLAMVIPGVTNKLLKDSKKAIRESEDNWYENELGVEACEYYQEWKLDQAERMNAEY